MDIQVGDIVILDDGQEMLMVNQDDIEDLKTIVQAKVIQVKRPKYEVVLEKKELLTAKEQQFLQSYIDYIKSLNNGKVFALAHIGSNIVLYLNSGLHYTMEIGEHFGKLQKDTNYKLFELDLEG